MIFTSVARLVIGLENAPVARARWQSNSEITSVVDFTPATCVCHRHPVSEPRLFDSRSASIRNSTVPTPFARLIEWRSALEKSIFPAVFPLLSNVCNDFVQTLLPREFFFYLTFISLSMTRKIRICRWLWLMRSRFLSFG